MGVLKSLASFATLIPKTLRTPSIYLHSISYDNNTTRVTECQEKYKNLYKFSLIFSSFIKEYASSCGAQHNWEILVRAQDTTNFAFTRSRSGQVRAQRRIFSSGKSKEVEASVRKSKRRHIFCRERKWSEANIFFTTNKCASEGR